MLFARNAICLKVCVIVTLTTGEDVALFAETTSEKEGIAAFILFNRHFVVDTPSWSCLKLR